MQRMSVPLSERGREIRLSLLPVTSKERNLRNKKQPHDAGCFFFMESNCRCSEELCGAFVGFFSGCRLYWFPSGSCFRRVPVALGRPFLGATSGIGNQFNQAHGRAIAASEPDLDNARVAPLTVLVTRSQAPQKAYAPCFFRGSLPGPVGVRAGRPAFPE